jgi:hypothetical protein
MQATEGESGYAWNVSLTSAARAVARNDGRLAEMIIARAPTIGRYVSVSPTKDVHLQNAEGFQAAVEESKRAYYQELQRNLEREPTAGGSSAAKKKRSRAYALTSLAKVWAPSDKRLVIAGIRCGSGDDGFVQVARKPLDRARALTAGWSPTFSALDRGSAEERCAFAKKWVTKVDFSDVALPSCDSITSFLAAAGESMPGPDGLPFSSWRATGARGAATLHAVLVHPADGGDVPLWFNDTLGKFAGKVMKRTIGSK